MPLFKFLNHNRHVVQLVGPNHEVIKIGGGKDIILSEYYIKYCPKYLRIAGAVDGQEILPKHTPKRITVIKADKPKPALIRIQQPTIISAKKRPLHTIGRIAHRSQRQTMIGRSVGNSTVATTKFKALIKDESFTISNSIGIGILSYNRERCISRLLDSIEKYTDLSQTTVFVSDESSDDSVKSFLRSKHWITLLDNTVRLGIAGNSNRLLRCLDRFKYKILLNDDVEIINNDWDSFYFRIMNDAGFHHFCYRQPGVYGASDGDASVRAYGTHTIKTIQQKPHGAVMAFDHVAFNKVGYFDTAFGNYGMEHVDWSNRVSLSGIQPTGFHDVEGSERFFIIHGEPTAVTTKSADLSRARDIYTNVRSDTSRIYVKSDHGSVVPSISFIIPYRPGQARGNAIECVIDNIRAQDFPHIEIILSEQDAQPSANTQLLAPMIHHFSTGTGGFCKSAAFNCGVLRASNQLIVLHDADILAQRNYTSIIHKLLLDFESCHIGRHVLYLDGESTSNVLSGREVHANMKCERIVGYFEGGSLGCHKDAFIKIGGFCERFVGYGNEDCEFFERLSQITRMCDARSIDFIHLQHGRSAGWDEAHRRNQEIHRQLGITSMESRHNLIRSEFKNKYNI